MQASAGGGISGAATRVAGPEFLSPCERPENVCVERVLRERDGLGFCRSGLAGRRVNPTLEITFWYCERTRIRLYAPDLPCVLLPNNTHLLYVPWYYADMADIFNLRANPDGQLAALKNGAKILRVHDVGETLAAVKVWESISRETLLDWRKVL